MEKFSGALQGLSRRRANRDFVLAQMQSGGTGATSVSLALAGMSGAALAANSIDSREEADYVEFELAGRRFKGWFWRFPFAEGDQVEVAGEKIAPAGPSGQGGDERWVAYGAHRAADGLVAVYPHSREGTRSHLRSSLKFWAGFALAAYLLVACLALVMTLFGDSPGRWGRTANALFIYFPPVLLVVFGFLGWRSCVRLKGFALLAEDIFRAFGWTDPPNIDLRKTSQAKRGEKESGDYGYFFFRY